MVELVEIFTEIKKFMLKYSPPLVAKKDQEGTFDLWSIKDVVITGRKKKEVYFAGVIIRKGYVGFYFMPVYVDAEIKKVFSDELLGLLKGKSCFHIRQNNPQIMAQIEKALKAGFDIYLKNGWI